MLAQTQVPTAAHQAGGCGGIGTTGQADDETTTAAAAQVVAQAEGDGTGELLETAGLAGPVPVGLIRRGQRRFRCRQLGVHAHAHGIVLHGGREAAGAGLTVAGGLQVDGRGQDPQVAPVQALAAGQQGAAGGDQAGAVVD
ncbi:MAG: hypothetical protein ACOC98_16670, partial [Thermodesulfobacteriota bacterium]